MSKYCFSDEPEVRAFKNGANADPQEIGEALKKIADANNGLLKPSSVVKAAADKGSRLHQYFEWDDAKAANSYRVSQARAIIRSVIITRDDENTPPIRAFVSISNHAGVAYRYSQDVIGSAELERAFLEGAEKRIKDMVSKFQPYPEVFSQGNALIAALKDAKERLNRSHWQMPDMAAQL
jgi:hypothetical protein